jgi:hypothetical protein
MKALKLFEGNDEAWDLLGGADGVAGYYGDNGGDPDGNAWLPNVGGDDFTEELMQKAVDAGLGEIVEVEEAFSDDEMLVILGLPSRQDVYAELDEDTVDALKAAANTQLQWAHYGAYGAGDSVWVFVKKG